MNKKLNMRLKLLFTLLQVSSCSITDSGEPLPGKIAICDVAKHECFIFNNSNVSVSSFQLQNEHEIELSGVTWLKSEDSFWGIEIVHGITPMEDKCNIVKLGIDGKVVERIYDAQKGEFAWPGFSSNDDRYLLFTTHRKHDPEKYPFEGLAPLVSLNVMDIEQHKVIVTIDSIGRIPNLKIEESPWLYQGSSFVYSIDSETKLRLSGADGELNPAGHKQGIYLFSLSSRDCKLLVKDGHTAIASPTSNAIAFQKDNSLRVLDLETNQERSIYEFGPKQRLYGVHWTPDGKSIYFAFREDVTSKSPLTGEKLIDVASGVEVPLSKMGLGFKSFTWK